MSMRNFEWLFTIKNANRWTDVSCRVGALHSEAFHGRAIREDHEKYANAETLVEMHPTVLNSIRSPLLLTRSGTFIPDVFFAGPLSIVVSEKVWKSLDKMKNILGLPVRFQHLVDLSLPAIGDMSWYDRSKRGYNQPEPEREYQLRRKLHVDEWPTQTYYELVGVFSQEMEQQFKDIREVEFNFGSYQEIGVTQCRGFRLTENPQSG